MMPRSARWILLAVSLGSTGACNVGPDYERPPVSVPNGYKSATPDEGGSPGLTQEWWKLFHDPELTGLEEAAIRANQDLKAAIARVDQARAALQGARSGLYPSVVLNPSIERQRTSANTALSPGHSVTFTDLRLPFDLSYEVDLWGKIRRGIEAAESQAKATSDDLGVVLHTMESDIASTYYQIRSLDLQTEILNRTVQSYQRQVDLLNTQLKAGLVGRISVAQAEALLYATVSQQADTRRQRADLEHALAILMGKAPADFALPVKALNLDIELPKVPAGLPAELLRRRPDVAEAEQNLAAASAQIGVAVSQYYPDLQLTGAAGWESLDFRHLLNWQSRIWSIGASVAQPIFEGGRIDASVDQARGRYAELLAVYRGQVLIAYRDVEDALTDLHLRSEAAQSLTQAVESSREYLNLADTQFKQGLISYFQVIDAERTLLGNELSAAQLASQRLVSLILLIKALGAGWEEGAPLPFPQEP
ncbi:MAG TPA: efflux transporter outer membrane subunit [Planctomycetota bacterium]|nr:efflux transporter outer membrane subunit [Planctomycetota bacterium]